MQADMKTKNRKKLKVKVLVDSRCTHTGVKIADDGLYFIFSFHFILFSLNVKIADDRLYFIFSFQFILFSLFSFLFLFLFIEQLSHKTDHEFWEKEVEDTRTK